MGPRECSTCWFKNYDASSEPCRSCHFDALTYSMSNYVTDEKTFWKDKEPVKEAKDTYQPADVWPFPKQHKNYPEPTECSSEPHFADRLKEVAEKHDGNCKWPLQPCGCPKEEVQQVAKPLETQVGGGHYKGLKIQPIEYIHSNNLSYCEANIVKYITRWRDKGGKQDLEKIKHYVDLLIQLERL